MVTKAKKKRKTTKKKSQSKKPTLSKTEIKLRQKQRSKAIKKVISSSSGIITAAAIIGGILFVIAGPKLAIAGGGGILIVGLSYLYPDMALWGFLIYLPFSGTVTYWIGGGSPIFQLAKDGFYFPALFAKYKEWKSKRMPMIVPKALKQPLMVLLAICGLTLLLVNGLQQLKPEGGDKPILLGLMGLKSFIGYLPLITCAYYQIKGKKELLFLTRLTLVLAIICCFLGMMQYQFLASGRCQGTDHLTGDDLFKATLDAKCLVGGSLVFSPSQNMIRLPGTFVAPWQWAWFLIANAFFTFASAFSDPSPLWRITGLVGMAMVFINAVISGQRIALALVPVVTIILLVLTGQVANLKRFLPILAGLGLILGIAAAASPAFLQERVDSFVGRWNASPPTDFISEQFGQSSGGQKGILGKGLGRATNAARIFGKTALIETYYPKMIFEIGLIGVAGFLYLVTTMVVIGFKSYRSVKDKNLRSFGASFWVFVLIISYNTYYYPLDVDPVTVYYWYFAGVLFKLPEIDREERKKLIEAGELDPDI
ncbi:hormogonium polysaccharide biosynthesis protein HpsL [Planktothrix agardhii]|uniref:hormogonium polysaccharide biosynthesis protein HpsL n=1 Tax=Planktothrix agardhii TaxID=1160 RepID=UPI001D0AC68B|nr:hormogonium polysaccharide biosynthesis protein HpsL [Planktothrix agardhii]MCB8788460.1 hormogonium polysaccharide biosynthesis protein HpsL [Planktothrix agardhii 1025]MCF3612573.1 hormogonium polysaccharide biosynthesis protein HpsL [Planktothrix agardhii 1027]MCF3646451.1 hormogonium polysaccharide biosynthesis protein HpsL [Planktothrix agardhii 1026]